MQITQDFFCTYFRRVLMTGSETTFCDAIFTENYVLRFRYPALLSFASYLSNISRQAFVALFDV